jgi:ribulose-5-phosphate 4-epimerase/fuculose-1-phosphate aldolase
MAVCAEKLVSAYHILAHLGLDDHTYAHLSIRIPGGSSFYIQPFGLRFEEVTRDVLMEVSFEGEVLHGKEYQYNRTGYMIHGSLYQHRPDLQVIFHIHTPEIVAVSACTQGLMPISQWALHFYDKVAYHAYNSLTLDDSHGDQLLSDLGEKKIMLLRNHGSITAGQSVEEVMFYTYHLQQACKAQCLALAMNQDLIVPPQEVCAKSVQDLLTFEQNLGERDWQAWIRLLHQKKESINLSLSKAA